VPSGPGAGSAFDLPDGPLGSPGAVARLAPFLAVAMFGIVAASTASLQRDLSTVIAPGVVTIVLAVLAASLPWRRWHPSWQATVPMLFFVVVVLLRDDFGGSVSEFTPLAALPPIWFALYGTRRQAWTSVGALAAVLFGPVVVIGAPHYSAADWQRPALWFAVCATITSVIGSLVAMIRQRAVQAEVAGARLDAAIASLIDGFLLARVVPGTDGGPHDLVIENLKMPGAGAVDPAQVVGRRMRQVMPEAVRTGIVDRYLEVYRTGVPQSWQTDGYQALGGRLESFSLHAVPTADGVAVAFRAVTEEIERTRALAASEAQMRSAFDDAPAGMAVIDLSGRAQKVNLALADLLGHARDSLVGSDLGVLLGVADRRRIRLRMAGLVHGGGTVAGFDITLQHPSGARLPVSVRCSLVRETDGKPGHVLVHVVDRTAEHEHARRLQAEREFNVAVLDTTHCPVVVLDAHGTVVTFNPAASVLTGYAAHEVVGRSLWDVVIPPDGREQSRAWLGDLSQLRVPMQHEGDWLTKAGGRRRLAWANAYLRDADGRPTHVVATGIDVTREIAATLFVTQTLDAAVATSVVATDLDGVVTLFNRGAEHLLGYTAAQVVGTLSTGAFHDPVEVAARAAELGVEPGFGVLIHHLEDADAPQTRDWTYVGADGSRRTVSLTVSPMADVFGVRTGYVGVAQDVTDVRAAGAAVSQALDIEREVVERLRELDQVKTDFVSTISHELRTPITSVVGYVDMMAEGLVGALTGDQLDVLAVVSRNSRRLLALIEDLLTLSRIESGAFRLDLGDVDVCEVVRGAREALGGVFSGRDLQVTFDLPSVPVPVTGDPAALERVVLNVLSNAVKFTPDGGRIDVVLTAAPDDGEVRVRVTDTGIGIPDGEQQHLFTRFFRSSTASRGQIQGSGLGLSIVRSIVEEHGGAISVHSQESVGTTVLVTLPLDQSHPDVGARRATRSPHPKTQEVRP
jgi:PAS domain S-box-containing protein